jgi:hypothetical protein
LTRLLGDALDCPTGGSTPEEDGNEPATEGRGRPGPWTARKGHFVLLDSVGGPAVPAPHKIAWRNLSDERVVHIVRDPRDVAVSAAFYLSQSVREFLPQFLAGEQWPHLGTWAEYVESWLDAPFAHVLTSYESLHRGRAGEVRRILAEARLPVDEERVVRAWERQSFARRRAWEEEHDERPVFGRAWNLRFMRKGIVGDWRNHLDGEMERAVRERFGPTMERLGYGRV